MLPNIVAFNYDLISNSVWSLKGFSEFDNQSDVWRSIESKSNEKQATPKLNYATIEYLVQNSKI